MANVTLTFDKLYLVAFASIVCHRLSLGDNGERPYYGKTSTTTSEGRGANACVGRAPKRRDCAADAHTAARAERRRHQGRERFGCVYDDAPQGAEAATSLESDRGRCRGYSKPSRRPHLPCYTWFGCFSRHAYRTNRQGSIPAAGGRRQGTPCRAPGQDAAGGRPACLIGPAAVLRSWHGGRGKASIQGSALRQGSGRAVDSDGAPAGRGLGLAGRAVPGPRWTPPLHRVQGARWRGLTLAGAAP